MFKLDFLECFALRPSNQLSADNAGANSSFSGIYHPAEYGDVRLNTASRRALAFDNIGYGSAKTILEKGLDRAADPAGVIST